MVMSDLPNKKAQQVNIDNASDEEAYNNHNEEFAQDVE